MFIVDGIAYAGEPQHSIQVLSVKVVNDLSLLVKFDSGEERVFDCSSLLNYPVFEKLEDQVVFNTVNVESGVIIWLDGELDISPEKVYALSYPYTPKKVV